jgi:hypothetical protein
MQNIRQYNMHGSTHSLSIPKGASFRGARQGNGWIALFFEHVQDWTHMEWWDLVAVPLDSSPVQVAGGLDEQYQFLQFVPAMGMYGDFFIYRKVS